MGSCAYTLGEEAFCKQVNKKTGALKHDMTQRVGVMGMDKFSRTSGTLLSAGGIGAKT